MKKAISKAFVWVAIWAATAAGSRHHVSELPGLEALDIVPFFKTPRGNAHVARRPPA
jgi:hypothetical protein